MSEGFIRSVPPLPEDFPHNSFDAAVSVRPKSSTTNVYIADIKRDWAIGLVAHGGYACAVVASAAQAHVFTHHPELGHTDVVTVQQEFISACNLGAAEVEVAELSLGRQYSTLRVQLFQDSETKGVSKRSLRVETLIRLGNLHRESLNTSGMSLPTITYKAQHGPLPPRSECIEWQDTPPLFARRTAYTQVRFLVPPRQTHSESSDNAKFRSSVGEQWMTWRNVEERQKGFSVQALCFIVDEFRPVPEHFGIVGQWYPTMSMSLEVKKGLADGKPGWEWLFLRLESHQIRNGRMDIDVVVLDEEGELVALSRHVALIVPSERNYKRAADEKAKGSQSKI